MPSPNTPALQKLHRLKGSSPDFYDQLSDVLYGEEYQQCVPILQGDDLVWLVDYLDKGRYHVAVQTLCLSRRRPSMVSILQGEPPWAIQPSTRSISTSTDLPPIFGGPNGRVPPPQLMSNTCPVYITKMASNEA